MDPGEYPTNVLSSNNFASIQYEYLEYQSPFSGTTRKQLQKLETAWRQEGLLVHCDAFKEGIWRFRGANNGTTDSQSQTSSVTERSIIEVQGKGLVLKEKGIYEPASLGRSKLNTTSSFSTSSISSSPSSSLESTIRNAQSLNSRAVQGNSNQSAINEPPTSSPGVKSATGLPENWPVLKDIHECFVSAALGSIVYFLCHDHSFVPLNSRTLILRTSDIKSSEVSVDNSIYGFDTVTLATLDISLTSLGTIVIKAQSDIAHGLQNLTSISNPSEGSTNIAPGAPLWLAPGGNAAKFYANRDDKNLPGSLLISHLQTNPTDLRLRCFNGVTIQSWQSKCLDWLSAKGLNTTILEDGGWIFVQVMNGNPPYLNSEYPGNPMLEDLTIVPWPSLLCFQTAGSGAHDVQSLPMNPLAFAEEWFINRDDRAAVIAKRQKERHAAEIKSKEQADMDARAAQAMMYSPAALRRGSNAGAMYPTPPDAIHHPIGATPTFDGTVSTPGQPNGLFPQDVEPTPHHTALGNTSIDADMWGSASKKDGANTTSMNFNDTDNGNDNLFDDVGVDMFADITDADFSFFDEPDTVQLEQPPTALGDATAMTLETSDPMDLITPETADPAPASIPATQVQDPDNEKTTDMVTQDVSLQKKDPEEADEIPKVLEKVDSKKAFQTPMISPPFDMESIFKRVARDPSLDSKPAGRRRSSVFNKVDFETSILSVNEKYGANGRFKFSDEIKVLPIAESPSLPKSQYLNQRRKHLDSDQDSRSLTRLLRDDTQLLEVTADEDHEMRYLVDSDLASQISEQDDTSHTTDDVSLMLKPGVKRKWTGDNDGEDMSSSFNALAVEYAQSAGTPLSITGSQIPLLEGDPADWSLTTYFTTPEPDVLSNVMSDLETIATAQILADQAVSGTLKLPGSATCFGSKPNTPFYKISSTKELMHTLVKATKSCFKDITKCTMQAYLEIQGIPVLNQAHRLPPRPIPNPRSGHIQDPSRTNNPYLISPPQLEVRRADSKLSILPSAIHFWDNLGLGPSEGGKDVSAVCVYPNIDGVSGSAITFLDQMQNTYEASRLGSHERLESKDMIDSLLPYAVDMTQQGSRIHQLASLKETTARLSRVLSSLLVEDKNFVVYFVYPVDNAALLVHICSAFQHLFNLYRKSLSEKKITTTIELVLQLVPLDFIASSISIPVPWPAEYSRLAMEVYDRCIDFKSYSSTPAILLEQPLPKNIDFKLTANPSASLLQENSCLHVAYAQSIDDRWITAAWTDNRGTKQMTASYCLGRKNEPISMPFSNVANEIWETTLDIISIKRIHWRIMITRVGVMDPSELEFWTGLAATESNAQINLTLLTVQTDPSLRLLPPSITLPPTSNPNQAISPVSTPQAPSIVSPDTASTPIRDANASAATPGETSAEPDSDARLIDYTDQTWGTVLAHRLNNSNSLLDLNPALISGYLIKRGGTNIDDPPIVMEVNIVHSEVIGNPRTFHEALLREVLGYYRGLGTLARVRGVVDPVRDIRPWHIAAAEKAVKALYMLM